MSWSKTLKFRGVAGTSISLASDEHEFSIYNTDVARLSLSIQGGIQAGAVLVSKRDEYVVEVDQNRHLKLTIGTVSATSESTALDEALAVGGKTRQIRVSVLWGREQVIALVGSKEVVSIDRSSAGSQATASPLVLGRGLHGTISQMILLRNGEATLRLGVDQGQHTLRLRENRPGPESSPATTFMMISALLCLGSLLLLSGLLWFAPRQPSALPHPLAPEMQALESSLSSFSTAVDRAGISSSQTHLAQTNLIVDALTLLNDQLAQLGTTRFNSNHGNYPDDLDRQ